MSKILVAKMIVIIITSMVFSFGLAQREEANVLVILNWPNYIDDSLIAEFEKQHRAQVKIVSFETGDTRSEMLLATQGRGFDIVVASANAAVSYVNSQWIEKLQKEKIDNLKHVDTSWLAAHPEAKDYAVPYLWGTVGIAYRADLVKKKVNSWLDLLKPEPYLSQKILMVRELEDVIGIGLKANQKSVNVDDTKALQIAEQMLLSQRPFVKDYTYVTLDENSSLVKGEIWLSMLYNGDALTLKELEPKIEYVVPKEGTLLWVDSLMIMKESKNKDLAYAFINFFSDPRNAAKNAASLNFATTNKSAMAFIPPEQLANPIIYPSEDLRKKSEVLAPLEARRAKRWNSIFAKLIK